MKVNRNKSLKIFQIEKVKKANDKYNSQSNLNNKSLYKLYYDKRKYPDFKIIDSSEDILTNFKTKTNIFNTNCKEYNSRSSLEDSKTFIDFKNKYDSKLNELSTKNEYIYMTDCGGINDFEKEEIIENAEDETIGLYLDLSQRNKDTGKIDYRYYTNYNDVKYINEFFQKNKINENEYCWLATYDKLIKRKKLIKILKFYGQMIDESKLIEKCLKIENYELFYNYNSNKPLIKPGKNFILVKLYLLSLEQINIIFNYLNRVNVKLNMNIINNYYRNAQYFKGKCTNLFSKCNYYPYPLLYYLGNYMNITIFSFSNYSYNSLYNENNNDANVNIKDSVNNQMQIYPSPKKLAKYIKLLMLNFPEKKYNFDFFIFYTIANIKYSNFSQKYLEINQIFNSYNISKDINYENKENKHKEIYKNDNNNNISENNIIQQLKDKILALDNDEEYNGENSEFNSQISKMINSNLKSNTIASDSSFIMNDLISSYCDTNSHTKNKTIEHNNNKNGKLNKSSFKIEKSNKDKKYFLNQIINLNKSYNSRLKNKNKSSSKQIKVKNIKDKFAGKLVKLNKIYTKDFKNFGNFYLESKSFSKKNNI
jgi:hypothetical protein